MDQKTRDELLKLFQGKLNEAMRLYLETCSRCGVCTKACHVHESMGQVKYIAAYRAEIVRRIYKKYFKGQGKVWSSLGEGKALSETALEELYEAAYSCTGCRRCMVYCPFGIDTQMLMSIAKLLLVGAHAEPEILTMLADTSVEKGKSLDLYKESFIKGIKKLEEEIGGGRDSHPHRCGGGRPPLCGVGGRSLYRSRCRGVRCSGRELDPELL
jgi:Fe-S oxidoreductase